MNKSETISLDGGYYCDCCLPAISDEVIHILDAALGGDLLDGFLGALKQVDPPVDPFLILMYPTAVNESGRSILVRRLIRGEHRTEMVLFTMEPSCSTVFFVKRGIGCTGGMLWAIGSVTGWIENPHGNGWLLGYAWPPHCGVWEVWNLCGDTWRQGRGCIMPWRGMWEG